MATTIYNIETGEVKALEFRVNGCNILNDIIGNSGYKVHSEYDFEMDSAEIEWWERWIERENRINEAYEAADQDTRVEYEKAVSDYGYDLEALQDVLEGILGIES